MKSHLTTGKNCMNRGRSKNRAFIDYLSLVFDLEELNRVKQQAKINRGINPEISFTQHYKDMLSEAEISAYDKILEARLADFIYQLNHNLDKDEETQRQLNDFDKWEIHNNHHGRFSYKHSARLTCEGVTAGIVCWGSENYGAMLSFTGVGCQALDFHKVYQLVSELGFVRITRVDLAHDDYAGTLGVNEARSMYKNGLFSLTNNMPSYRYIESGHLDYSGVGRGKMLPSEGRSFYVGKRENGKMCRIYEKGKQLQSTSMPDWVRWEVEIRNVEREIPLEVLIDPTAYLAATYPCLNHLSQEQKKIKVFKEKVMVSFTHLLKYNKIGYGKLINFARQVLEWSDKDIVDALVDGLCIDSFPERIKSNALLPPTT